MELGHALFATHQDAEGTRTLEEGVAQFPQDDLLLSDLGSAYLRNGETEQAAAVLERAVKANPERYEPHNLLGVIARGRGDLSAAEREFREPCDASRTTPRSTTTWGICCFNAAATKRRLFISRGQSMPIRRLPRRIITSAVCW